MPIELIQLDMDGVMADFEQHVVDTLGVPFDTLSEDDIKVAADQEGFFASIPPMKDYTVLLDGVFSYGIPVGILSATGKRTPERVLKEKNQWLDTHTSKYPFVERCFSRRSVDKAEHAAPNRVLIDDRLKALDPYTDAGGLGILHISAKNTLWMLESLLDELSLKS